MLMTETKKKETEEVKEPVIRVTVVPVGPRTAAGLEAFGEELERVFNDGESTHRLINFWNEPRGTVMVWRRRDSESAGLLPMIFGAIPTKKEESDSDDDEDEEGVVKLEGTFSSSLINAVLNHLNLSASEKDQVDLLETMIKRLIPPGSTEEMRKTITDCDALLQSHAEQHKHNTQEERENCPFHKTVQKLKVALEGRLAVNLC